MASPPARAANLPSDRPDLRMARVEKPALRVPETAAPDRLPSRLTALLLLAGVAGNLPPSLLLLGLLLGPLPESSSGFLSWLLSWSLIGGLSLGASLALNLGLGLLLRPLADRWITHPLTDLLRGIERIEAADVHRQPRLHLLEELPVTPVAPWEIRQLAAAFHRAYGQSIRGRQEARRIRRSLDERVEQATERATARLRRLAMRDALTGLGNRRFLEAAWPGLFQAARASETDLVCVMLDLDHFKVVNDQWGHSTGDQLLITLSQMITGHLRRNQDIAVRLGGDEFLLLMPGATAAVAVRAIENLRRHFGRFVAAQLPSMANRLGISAGVATIQELLVASDHPPDPSLETSGKPFFNLADARLYQAKRQGRGQSVVA